MRDLCFRVILFGPVGHRFWLPRNKGVPESEDSVSKGGRGIVFLLDLVGGLATTLSF